MSFKTLYIIHKAIRKSLEGSFGWFSVKTNYFNVSPYWDTQHNLA